MRFPQPLGLAFCVVVRVHVFQLPGSPLCCRACAVSFPVPRPALCAGSFELPVEVCMLCLSHYPGLPSVEWGFCGFLLVPMPAIWPGPQSLGCLWAEKCILFCFLPSRSQLSPLGPPVRNSPVHRKSSFLTTPSLRWAQAPVQKFSISSLFKSPSSLLPHSRERSLPHWRSGAFF